MEDRDKSTKKIKDIINYFIKIANFILNKG